MTITKTKRATDFNYLVEIDLEMATLQRMAERAGEIGETKLEADARAALDIAAQIAESSLWILEQLYPGCFDGCETLDGKVVRCYIEADTQVTP